jgi:hypothetical protein
VRYPVFFHQSHRPLEQVSYDQTGQHRGKHLSHKKNEERPHSEKNSQDDHLGVGKMMSKPIANDLHDLGSFSQRPAI